MSLLNADCVEPYTDHKGRICMMSVQDGMLVDIDVSAMYDPEMYTREERKIIEKYLKYRWPLPHRLDTIVREPPERDLPQIHGDIMRYLQRYVWFPHGSTYDALANWVISTYFRPQLRFAPLLVADGISDTGKSTLANCLEKIAYRATVWNSISAPAMAREIEHYDATLIMDEAIDSLQSDRGADIFTMVKSCFEQGRRWIRADRNGNENNVYSVYTSIAMCIKGATLPEDVRNRSLRMNLTPAPPGTKFDILSWESDITDGSASQDIRTNLYKLRLWSMCREDDHRAVSLMGPMMTTLRHMREKTEDGRYLYAMINDIEDAPEIKNRDLDIASTLYTIAQLTNSERGTIEEMLRNKEDTREIIMDTPEAIAFCAFAELVEEKCPAKDIGYDLFEHAVSTITTTEIAQRFNLILDERGDGGRDKIATKTVTAKIAALGFKYRTGEGNRSFMVPGDQCAYLFVHNVSKFIPNKKNKYANLRKR